MPSGGYRLLYYHTNRSKLQLRDTELIARAFWNLTRNRSRFAFPFQKALSQWSGASVAQLAATFKEAVGADFFPVILEAPGCPQGVFQRDLFAYARAFADYLREQDVTVGYAGSHPSAELQVDLRFFPEDVGSTAPERHTIEAGIPVGIAVAEGIQIAGLDYFRSLIEGRRIPIVTVARNESTMEALGLPAPIICYPGPFDSLGVGSLEQLPLTSLTINALDGAIRDLALESGYSPEWIAAGTYVSFQTQGPGASETQYVSARFVFDPTRFPKVSPERFEKFTRAIARRIADFGVPSRYVENTSDVSEGYGKLNVSEDFDLVGCSILQFDPDLPLIRLSELTARMPQEDPTSYVWRIELAHPGILARDQVERVSQALERIAIVPSNADWLDTAIRRIVTDMLEQSDLGRAGSRFKDCASVNLQFRKLSAPPEAVMRSMKGVIHDLVAALDGDLRVPPYFGGRATGDPTFELRVFFCLNPFTDRTPIGLAVDEGFSLVGPSYAASRPGRIALQGRIFQSDEELATYGEIPPISLLEVRDDAGTSYFSETGPFLEILAPLIIQEAKRLFGDRWYLYVRNSAAYLDQSHLYIQTRTPYHGQPTLGEFQEFVQSLANGLGSLETTVSATETRGNFHAGPRRIGLQGYYVKNGVTPTEQLSQMQRVRRPGSTLFCVMEDFDLTALTDHLLPESPVRGIAKFVDHPFLLGGTNRPEEFAKLGPASQLPRWGIYIVSRAPFAATESPESLGQRKPSDVVGVLNQWTRTYPGRVRTRALLRVLAARSQDDDLLRRLERFRDDRITIHPLYEIVHLVGLALRSKDPESVMALAADIADKNLAGESGILALLPAGITVMPATDDQDLGMALLDTLWRHGWGDYLAWLWPTGPAHPGTRWVEYPECLREFEAPRESQRVFQTLTEWMWSQIPTRRRREVPPPNRYIDARVIPALAEQGIVNIFILQERPIGEDLEFVIRVELTEGRYTALRLRHAHMSARFADEHYRAHGAQLVLESFILSVLTDLLVGEDIWNEAPEPLPTFANPGTLRVLAPDDTRAETAHPTTTGADFFFRRIRLAPPITVAARTRKGGQENGNHTHGTPATHWVVGHPRSLPEGAKASPRAIQDALNLGMQLQPGVTFVSGHYSPRIIGADEEIERPMRVTRAVDVFAQTLRQLRRTN